MENFTKKINIFLIMTSLFLGFQMLCWDLYLRFWVLPLKNRNPEKFKKQWPKERIWNYTVKKLEKIINSFGVNVVVKNKKLLKKINSGFIVANHSGNFDPFLVALSSTKKIDFIAKKELKKQLFIGQLGLFCDVQWIERGNSEQTAALFLNIARQFKKEQKIYSIFPEGTRSNSNKINEFKVETFKFIKLCKQDTILFKIENSWKIWAKRYKNIKNKEVSGEFIEIMYYKDYKDISAHEMAKIARKKIIKGGRKWF